MRLDSALVRCLLGCLGRVTNENIIFMVMLSRAVTTWRTTNLLARPLFRTHRNSVAVGTRSELLVFRCTTWLTTSEMVMSMVMAYMRRF